MEIPQKWQLNKEFQELAHIKNCLRMNLEYIIKTHNGVIQKPQDGDLFMIDLNYRKRHL
jgi:hypothetical protein